MGRNLKYTKEILQEHVNVSRSIAQVLKKLDLKYTGNNYAYIKSRMKKFNIDFSHFLGQGYQKGLSPKNKKQWFEVLIKGPNDCRLKSLLMRRCLIESGTAYICSRCGCDGNWQGDKITLQVDHIDGDFQNNEKSNLRFLCPNCHSATPTWCNKNREKKTEVKLPKKQHVLANKQCIDCDKHISTSAIRCKSCAGKHASPTKIIWPSIESLRKMIEEGSYSAVGKQLGVSDNAVRQRIKRHSNIHL